MSEGCGTVHNQTKEPFLSLPSSPPTIVSAKAYEKLLQALLEKREPNESLKRLMRGEGIGLV